MMVTLEDGTEVMHRHNAGMCPENCFGCKAANVGFASSAMPTRKPQVVERKEWEKTTVKDLAAYKRLRQDGLQPKATKGAAELESRAASKWEAETGQNLGGNAKLGAKLDDLQGAVVKGDAID
jgi:hypothetical protein